jgi:hypothetical protein
VGVGARVHACVVCQDAFVRGVCESVRMAAWIQVRGCMLSMCVCMLCVRAGGWVRVQIHVCVRGWGAGADTCVEETETVHGPVVRSLSFTLSTQPPQCNKHIAAMDITRKRHPYKSRVHNNRLIKKITGLTIN